MVPRLSKSPVRAQAAFTLVEMLLVVALISLLIALLLPSLSKARREALIMGCHANSGQIGAALSGFSTDNLGRLPYVGPLYRNQQMGYIHYWTEYWPDSNRVHGFQNWGLLSKAGYMHHQSEVWLCPLSPQDNSRGDVGHWNNVPGEKNTVLVPGDEKLIWAHARVGYLRRLMNEPSPTRSRSIKLLGGQAFFADTFSTRSHVAARHRDHIVVSYGDQSVRRHRVDLTTAPWSAIPNDYGQSWPAAQTQFNAVWKSFE